MWLTVRIARKELAINKDSDSLWLSLNCCFSFINRKKKAMARNSLSQNQNPAFKTKVGNNLNVRLTERTTLSQKVFTLVDYRCNSTS